MAWSHFARVALYAWVGGLCFSRYEKLIAQSQKLAELAYAAGGTKCVRAARPTNSAHTFNAPPRA